MNPTFKISIIKNRVRKDGTYTVFIGIGFKSQYTYVATPFSAGKTEQTIRVKSRTDSSSTSAMR